MPKMADAGQSPITQPLREDFAALEPVLGGITALVDRVRLAQRCHALLLTGALSCLEAFQRRHDEKVERVLLRALASRDGSLVKGVAHDTAHAHRETRRRLAELRRGVGDSGMLNRAIAELAAEFVTSLRAHAESEAESVFATADRPGEKQALRALAAAIDPRREPRSEGIAYTAEIVAAHVMRPWPRTVRPADTLARAAEFMEQGNVRELPVVEDGRLHGIVSRTDLQAHAGHLEWTRVAAAMTARPVVVTPEQPVGAVSQVLMRGSFNAVPVVTDDATLIGMISRSDMLRAVAERVDGVV
jgi:CBS domain-containing protein